MSDQPDQRPGTLPYTDTKPQGAADFYFAINATFRFILRKTGRAGWIAYLREMARDYYRPVWNAWRLGGLDAVARYLEDAFGAEPEAGFAVRKEGDTVVLEVAECPAIRHLRKGARGIVPEFCQHCYFQYAEMAHLAGLHMRLEGGNGVCRQTFSMVEPAPQVMEKIAVAQ